MAYIYSVLAVLVPEIFPDTMRGRDGAVGVYFEAAAVIVTLILLGQVMELRARSQTGAAIKALLGLAPKTARKISENGSEADIPLEHVQVRGPAAGSGRARRCRWTGRWSTAAARWMNR